MKANKILLLTTSLATLIVLAVAAWQENFGREWRIVQRQVRARLAPESAAAFPVQLRQIVVPSLKVTDRCVSCHVGMAAGETGIAGDRVFGAHPPVVHDPAEFGCVVCHGGQGRASDKADAHGEAAHWPVPMLPKSASWAGCGACHTHLAVPNEALLAAGRDLFERADCLSCHRMDGRGGTLRPGERAEEATSPDLSRAGAAGYDRAWYEGHLSRAVAPGAPPRWRDGFGTLEPAERAAIGTFLDSRMGAPGFIEAKALFHSLGCRGCHKVGGVGGDDGPDLTRVGEKDPGRLDWTHVPPPHTLENWLAEHFRSPASVVPGSAMPVLGLSEEEIRSLTFAMLSLRRTDAPEAWWPKDRIRAERFGEREFATDGATIYGTFCAACHGPRGEGMRYPGAPAFPAIANPDFLAIASDAFIAATVTAGRPGRRMPAWGEKDGGLRPAEVAAVVARVRELGGGIAAEPDPRPPRWVKGDAAAGGQLYAENCASCHGKAGEGAEGPSVNNPVFLRAATDTYLVETIRRGRRGTSMPSFAVSSTTHRELTGLDAESVVAFLRSWDTSSPETTP